jgi:hypothetical protein
MWDFVRKPRRTNIAFQGGRTTRISTPWRRTGVILWKTFLEFEDSTPAGFRTRSRASYGIALCKEKSRVLAAHWVGSGYRTETCKPVTVRSTSSQCFDSTTLDPAGVIEIPPPHGHEASFNSFTLSLSRSGNCIPFPDTPENDRYVSPASTGKPSVLRHAVTWTRLPHVLAESGLRLRWQHQCR